MNVGRAKHDRGDAPADKADDRVIDAVRVDVACGSEARSADRAHAAFDLDQVFRAQCLRIDHGVEACAAEQNDDVAFGQPGEADIVKPVAVEVADSADAEAE